MKSNTFLLSFTEGSGNIRKCIFLKKLYSVSPQVTCFLCEISPEMLSYDEKMRRNIAIKYIIIMARYEGDDLNNIDKYPFYVNVFTVPENYDITNNTINLKDFVFANICALVDPQKYDAGGNINKPKI